MRTYFGKWLSRKSIINKMTLFFILFALSVPHFLFLLQPFFMDEEHILRNILKFFSERTIVPYHANYPTFYSYLASPFVAFGAAINFLTGNNASLRESAALLYKFDPLTLIFPARVMTLGFLLLSGGVLYKFCVRRFGDLSAALVFIFLLASPAFLAYGSYGLPDVATMFFSIASLLFVLKFMEKYDDKKSIRFLLIAGVFSGLAISTKYSALSSVVPIGISVLYLYFGKRISFRLMAFMVSISGAVCVFSFLLGSPGWILKPQLFFADLMYEVKHAKYGHMGASGIPLLGNIELLLVNAPVILISSLLGLIVYVRNKNELGLIALVSFVSSVVLAATSAKQSLHYMYPAFGGLFIFVAFAGKELERFNKAVVILFVCAVLSVPIFNAYQRSLNYLKQNTTLAATQWMYENIPEGSKVAHDWAYVPKVYSYQDIEEIKHGQSSMIPPGIPEETAKKIGEEIARSHKAYEVIKFFPRKEWLRETDAEFFVTSSGVYDRFFKFGRFTEIEPPEDSKLFEEFHNGREFYEELFNSPLWHEVYSTNTGNGPLTRIFQRFN